MVKRHVRRDDLVQVISGNDSGKEGKILRVIPHKSRVIIEGVNVRWKNLRKSQKNPKGARVKREMPIHISNVKLVERPTGEKKVAKKKTAKEKK